MAKARSDATNEEQAFGSEDAGEVVTLTREEFDRLTAAGDSGANPAPAIEEGPHLDDPDIRAAKRDQLRAAGIDHEAADITDDCRDLLREEG